MRTEGKVREWHGEEGWGVIVALETPGGCWAHFSAILANGYRELHGGDAVTFTYERVGQDGYQFRAVDVWPPGVDHSTVRPQRRVADAKIRDVAPTGFEPVLPP